MLSEHLSQSTSAPPIQDGADKFLVCSSSKKILRQKLHDTQLGGIEQVNTEQVAMKIRAHKCSTAKSQSLNNQAKNPQNIILVLFLRMDVNDSSDFFSKKNRPCVEYLNILNILNTQGRRPAIKRSFSCLVPSSKFQSISERCAKPQSQQAVTTARTSCQSVFFRLRLDKWNHPLASLQGLHFSPRSCSLVPANLSNSHA